MRDANTLHGTIDTRVKLWARRKVYRTEITDTVSTFDTPGISPSVFAKPQLYQWNCPAHPPNHGRRPGSMPISFDSYTRIAR